MHDLTEGREKVNRKKERNGSKWFRGATFPSGPGVRINPDLFNGASDVLVAFSGSSAAP